MPLLARNRIRLLAVYGLIFYWATLGQATRSLGDTRLVSDDYLIKTWDSDDNLAGSTVTAVEQTPDGYLWVGTYEGLIRFDGIHSVSFDSLNTPALSHSRIQGLYLDARGTLWINTYRGGLTSYRNGVFRLEWPDQTEFDFHTTMVASTPKQVTFVTQYGEVLTRSLVDTNAGWKVLMPPATNSRPIFQCVDRHGNLWFISREGRILRVMNGKFEELQDDGGLGDKRVLTLSSDGAENVWAGAENEIAEWEGSHFVDFTPTNMASGEELDPTMIFRASSGAFWILDNDRLREEIGRRWTDEATQWQGLLGSASGRAMGTHEDSAGGIWFNQYGNGVFYISPEGRFQRFTVEDGLPGNRVGAWFQDRDGGVWLGIDRGGLARLTKRDFKVIGAAEGLPARSALSVCQDGTGTLWIGTTGGGLCSFRDGKLADYPVGSSMSANFVFSIFPQSDGSLWMSAGDGEDLFEFRDGQAQRSPLNVHGVKSLLVDRTGRLWAGTKINVGWYSATGRRVFSGSNGVTASAVRTLAGGPDGTIWAGSDDGTLYRCGLTNVQAFRPNDDLGPRPIWSLLVDSNGVVWAGTFRGGLLRFKDGKFIRLGAKQGLPMEVITQILEDQQGRFWFGTHQGICCVEKSALEACADGEADTVDVVRYLNGLPELKCSDGYQPACWSTRDGQLWFTTTKGVISVNPDEMSGNSLPPPVVIENLSVDGQAVSLVNGKVVVPPGHEQYEFQFTALNFDSPEQSRFRYRIDGLDKTWVESGARHMANYVHLPPNHYRFHVIACNSDGVWNNTGASVDFTVLPYFYETRWFLTAMVLLVLGSVIITVRTVATRKYRQALSRLAQQHAVEQDRARIAKDIHDDIGAGLTQITLLSELGRREPDHAGAQLERISEAARDLTRAMDEIVWAVDPQRDTLASLMDYISAYAEDFLRAAGIRCRMDFPAALPAMSVDAELRYNLFLGLKEVLNNVVKHAQATEVKLQLNLDSAGFHLVVEDNGHGFEGNGKAAASVDRLSSGLGLSNLRERLQTVGGECRMQSSPGKGTRIEMSVAFNGKLSPVMAIGADEYSE